MGGRGMKGRRGYPGSPGRYGTPGKVCQSVSLSVCQSVSLSMMNQSHNFRYFMFHNVITYPLIRPEWTGWTQRSAGSQGRENVPQS